MYQFLEENEVLYNNQFGFREHHSTTHAMIKVLDESLKGLDDKDFKTGAVFLDISKAFDTVNHSLLIKKLDHYGIKGLPLKVLKSYLSNRHQYTSMSGNFSESSIAISFVSNQSILFISDSLKPY